MYGFILPVLRLSYKELRPTIPLFQTLKGYIVQILPILNRSTLLILHNSRGFIIPILYGLKGYMGTLLEFESVHICHLANSYAVCMLFGFIILPG